jgi:cell division protein FtsL
VPLGPVPPDGARRTRLTSRAAVLAIVVCAVVLSLAYPVREYIAEHREMDELEATNAQVAAQVRRLEAERSELATPAYVEQLARDELHMCFPAQTCYVVVVPTRHHAAASAVPAGSPWYELLWKSVKEADKAPAQ